ncbi:hypothetical protein [Sinorhizobium meliloti]|uniref:hypothetical protein n=1 Tax=Rhizobium meliloti TaxID=382 RepID=UPI0001E4AC97|nr:hypothetical protein [Sinorhizobium meliloti]AEG57165.1 hypothetical protein Sinme_5585 [Sinorhizobium meliloti AK83]MDE4587433.1 hypothetical protein [Sinorhizobium meliloti]MDX0234376.1 hypothetical protein [Sinorhizobium meliloti]SEJ80127.1 hypothetical protein SAMN04244575_06292 [Sinorhizobium meliloti]
MAGMTGSAGQSRIHRNEVYAELRNPANYRPMPKQQTDYQNTRGRLPEAFDRGAVLAGNSTSTMATTLIRMLMC